MSYQAEPQGNAMSVRITASGAVVVALLACMTAPASACDDRFVKKCEAESAAAWAAENAPEQPAARRKPMRVRPVAAHVTEKPTPVRRDAPQRPAPAFELASDESRPAAPSPAARRFLGFIAPVSMAVNPFEALRKPRLDAEHLEPMPYMPVSDVTVAADEDAKLAPADALVEVQAEAPIVVAANAAPAAAVTVAQPAAPVAAAPATSAPPAAVAPPAQAQVVSQAPPADEKPRSGFPMHLVLALCGALGVAGALRFIVGT